MSRPPAPAPAGSPVNPRTAGRRWMLWSVLAAAAAACGLYVALRHGASPASGAQGPVPFVMPDEKTTFAAYAGSQSCRECHAAEFGKWVHAGGRKLAGGLTHRISPVLIGC